jgi:hypothetical protein
LKRWRAEHRIEVLNAEIAVDFVSTYLAWRLILLQHEKDDPGLDPGIEKWCMYGREWYPLWDVLVSRFYDISSLRD